MQTSKILNEVLVLSLPYTGRYFTYVTGGRHFSFVLRLWNSSPQEERNNAPAGRLSLKRTVQLFQAVNTKQTQPWKSECHTLPTWSSAALLLCCCRARNLFVLIYETNKWSPSISPPGHLSCSASLLQPVTCWMLTDDAPEVLPHEEHTSPSPAVVTNYYLWVWWPF